MREIIMPEMKEKSVKDLIVSILSEEWPLSLKRIYLRIKKRGISVSYQAVHKAINELIEKGVIKKEKKEYKISLDWIKNIKDFSEKLEKNYKEKRQFVGDLISFTANTVWELYPIFIDLFRRDVFKAGKKSICFIGSMVFNPQMGSEKELEAYRELMKKYKFIIVAKSNSLINKIWKTYWENIGVKVKINANIQVNPYIDTFIIGDYAIQIFYPEEVINKETKIMDSVKKASDINVADIHDLFLKNYGKIHVTALRNKELAESLRKKVEGMF